ncbi:MAG: condensation domain protein [Bryobacterales bacterium]|nr:condensation domain protein [Bryobacterales bacterium]
MKRKLSHIEHIVEGNIVYFLRLEGHFSIERLQLALARVQHKHPALRALIREERGGLYYEADCAPEIPLRIVQRFAEDDYRRECERELNTAFAHGQPLLRAVWLQSELESDLLFSTSHRICDGASMLIIVKEVLRSLYANDELIPYEPITRRDIIGDFQPPQARKRKLTAFLLNGLLRAIPTSRRTPENKEHFLEWSADRTVSNLLRQRCKAEGVSVHAVFLVALDRALAAVFGEKLPKWIENPVDIRRGRFPALKDDMLFFGGGNFKVQTRQSPDMEFWARARALNDEIRKKVEQELVDIPGRFHFAEMLCPLKSGQIQSIVRLGDALKMNGSWNRFAFSNLGNIVISDSDAPFRVKDLRLYMHSLNFRALCLVTYTLDGEMRFYCVADEKCMSRNQASAFKREFLALLQDHLQAADASPGDGSRTLAAVAE